MAVYSYANENNLFSLHSKTTYSSLSFSFSYNESSTLYTLSEDYGLLFDEILSTDDYGNIASTATLFEEYGSVADNNTPSNGRVGKIISATKYSIARASEIQGTVFLLQGKSNYHINSSYIGYGILSYSNGISSEKNTESYVGTGKVFGFGSKAERVVASYNNSSVVSFESIDYGLITGSVETIEDYGSILDDPNLPEERDDYGLITGRGLRPFGLTSFHSSLIEKNTENYVGLGKLFNFGNAKVFVLPIHYGKGTLKIRGAYSDLKNTESYVGTGSLFGFGSKAERTAVSYNLSSTVDYEGLDYGLITSAQDQIEDYGSILDDPNLPEERDDYGLIIGRGLRPFGLTSFHSSLIEKNTENYVGSGALFNFGTAKIFVLPIHYGKGTLKIRGAYSDLKNTESYVGTGRAFGFGSKAERTAVSYNLSSTVDYEGLDYGLITGSAETIEDYGLIADTELYGQQTIDYGLITGRGLRPFGLTSFSGLLVEKNTENYVGSGRLFNFGEVKVFVLPKHIGRGFLKIRGAYSNLKNTESYVGTGSLFAFSSTTEAFSPKPPVSGLFRISGSVVEKNTENYVGSGRLFEFGNVESSTKPSYIGTGSISINGAYSNLKNTESYVGTGRAFGFGSKAERTAVSYNLSSTVDYEGLDYGLITSAQDQIEDYGSILDDPNLPEERDDYGLITGRGLRPFGLTSFHSSLIEKNTENYVGLGKLFNFGNVESSTKPSYIGTGSISISGAYSDLKNTESYVGTGSLFGFGSKAESITASYNESSVVSLESIDYGLITGSVETIEDYGSILDDPNLPEERDDYGLITGRGLRPFGLTSFHSSLIEKNTENYVGSGALFVFVSKTETNTYAPSSTGLFKFGGLGVEKNTEVYVGTGRAFGFGSKAERTVVSYNQSSIIDYEGLDYGSITSTPDQTDDYGFITDTELYGQQTIDYGLLTGRGLRPYGLTTFSGHLVEKNTESYVGKGSLFAFSSTTEAFGPKPPASGLFRISGAATQSITPTTEIGSGSIFTFNSSTTVLLKANIGTGLFTFSGHLVEKNTESYVGTGSLFAFSSTTEAFGPKPPSSGLFRISGAATQSITPTTEIGSGTVTVSQATQILDAEDKTRLVAAYERVSYEEIGEPIAIRLSGKVGLYFQFRETGSGTLKVRGRAVIRLKPIHIGSGSYFIRGSASESTTPATEVGSGSIFTFVSKTEAVGANPPENTALFKFSSSSIVRNTESYVGIGLERINVESLIIIKLRYPGSGSISISPKGIERRNYSHLGSGNLFGFGSASEYLTNAYERDLLVIKIRGSAKDSHTERYIGSGSIFAFVSGAESKGSNPPENIALFKFSGASVSRTQPIEVGSGKLKFSEGSGRPDRNNKTFIVSSDESSSFRTIEEPTQIKVFGSAGTSRPTVYTGRGSLFGFGSKSESATFNPSETKELFKISGSASEKNTESYIGKGSIFSVTGSSYSITTRPKETTTLFNIDGSANESFAEGNYTGSGSIFTDIQSRTRTTFSPKSTTTLFQFVGSSKERNTEAYNGSGSIGIFISTGRSVFYDYKVSQKAFRIFGNTFESFGKSNYNGSSQSIISGLSENQKKNYVAPKRTRIFII